MKARELRAPQLGQRQETTELRRKSAYWLPEGREIRSLNTRLSAAEERAALSGLAGRLECCGLLGLGGSRWQSKRTE